ncbi:selenocysteine methyltransferase-like isoform X2 [Quercus lobata]|uniref:selenocysteine methyltransferase-like isoform X2 n=1 Tax=Quercus lobata TaxID=97700 RepID=UPI0012468253|nr:selenocysteine methyltransferase-like isoform X2 [Quercus lobata]
MGLSIETTSSSSSQSQWDLMREFVESEGRAAAVLDGGLATELERHGADLNDPLWSAKCLLSSPHLIRQVHLDYLEAGADVIITASYQATIQGFQAKGFSREEGENLLRRSVEIAIEARDNYYNRCAECSSNDTGVGRILQRRPILVAASVGSYGAYLADGSEYSGDYGDAITLETLKDFHLRRVQVLAESSPDLIAFETIPNKLEAQAYAEILEEEDIKIPAWFCFNSKNGVNVVSKKPIVIYPNSGERYDAEQKQWVQNTGVSDEDFVSYVNRWCEIGASLVGGCCRTTPNTIKAIYRTLSNRSAPALPP